MAVGLGGGGGGGESKVNVEMIKKQIKLKTCVIPYFHEILTCKSFYGIMSVIQGQRVNFELKFMKKIFVTNTNINKKHILIIILLFESVFTGESI